ncbi:MAG: hypothetical protein ACLTDA_10665 [[Eubacterium] siraeum]
MDEDGYSKVGDYSILITDKDSKPVYVQKSALTRTITSQLSCRMGRLLDYEDRTTVRLFVQIQRQQRA